MTEYSPFKMKGFSKHATTPSKLVKPKKSKVSAHGQLNDAEAEYKEDKKLYRKTKRRLRKAKKVDKPKKPTFRKLKKYSDLEKYDDDRG
tara:strand:- start:78 stop:344 length:267 start_codon:yes stop_codon:yes gene_type:complete